MDQNIFVIADPRFINRLFIDVAAHHSGAYIATTQHKTLVETASRMFAKSRNKEI